MGHCKFSLCTVVRPSKKLEMDMSLSNFFEGRDGCTQAAVSYDFSEVDEFIIN